MIEYIVVELEEQFRNICQELFKDCETEQELNNRYDDLRELVVCEMSDRAEYLGIDPDTL